MRCSERPSLDLDAGSICHHRPLRRLRGDEGTGAAGTAAHQAAAVTVQVAIALGTCMGSDASETGRDVKRDESGAAIVYNCSHL